MLDWFARHRSTERRAVELYGSIVTQARHPAFYLRAGVPDTPEGRFEMIVAHIVVALQRLSAEGEAGRKLGQALVEVFVTDMDDSIREMGIGDTGVARRVKKAAAALYDRHKVYAPALAAGDRAGLAEHVRAAIWGDTTAGVGSDAIAAALARAAEALAGQSANELLAGRATWPRPFDDAVTRDDV